MLPKNTARLTKVDVRDSSNVIAGATFKLQEEIAGSWTDMAAPYDVMVTNASGVILLEKLPNGPPRFVETIPAPGYCLPAVVETHDFTVGDGNHQGSDFVLINPPMRVTVSASKRWNCYTCDIPPEISRLLLP